MARKTAAFITTLTEQEYTTGIADGMRAALLACGYDLVVISATMQGFNHLRPDHLRAAFLEARDADFDVYVVLAGVLRHRARQARMSVDRLFALLPSEKTLILEDHIEGFRCLYKNNVPGMRGVMEHVLDECHCTKVGFVSGPVTSYGAREREGVYRDEMARRGLKVEPRWFARGLFQGGPQELIDEYITRNPDLEAVVCATDPLALNVYSALEELHLRPGIDVLVTGYDDQPCASVADPPLTTVSLNPFDFGYVAGTEAVNLLEGRSQTCETISGELLTRLSCGEVPANGRQDFESLVGASPFPQQQIAMVILRRCCKRIVATDDSPYLGDIEAMVGMAHELHIGTGIKVDTTQFLPPERMRHLVQGTELGILRMDQLQVALDDYLAVLIESATGRAEKDLLKLLLETDQAFMRYMNRMYYQMRPASVAREISMSCIAEAGVLCDDRNELIGNILRELANCGLSHIRLALVDEPVALEGKEFELPTTLRLVGETDGSTVKVHGLESEALEMSLAQAVHMPSREDGEEPRTLGLIGLYRGHTFYGVLAAELGCLSRAQFHVVSLNVTHALRCWHQRA